MSGCRLSRRSAFLVFHGAWIACAWLLAGAAHADGPLPEDLASQILNSAGVRRGLYVHLGCGDGALTAALGREGTSIVHGLSDDPVEVARARAFIDARGMYGTVSVEQIAGYDRLPYARDMVNLIVVDRLDELVEGGLSLRDVVDVLAPRGVAYVGGELSSSALETMLNEAGAEDVRLVNSNGTWAVFVKPWPDDMDEWPQYRHDPSHTAVSNDRRVGVPTGVRWISGRAWDLYRPHMQGLYSANGRLFYRYMRNPHIPGVEAGGMLIARDAFNGKELWSIEAGIGFGAQPFVAIGDYCYTTLEKKGPVVKLDAVTGKALLTFGSPAPVTSITYHKGVLIFGPGARAAYDTEGNRLWFSHRGCDPVIATGDNISVIAPQSPGNLLCLDLKTGREKWRVENVTGRLCAHHDGVLLIVDEVWRGPQLNNKEGTENFRQVYRAYSASDGSLLWGPMDLPLDAHHGVAEGFFLKGLLWINCWVNPYKDPDKREYVLGLDPRTGEEKKRLLLPNPRRMKHRCFWQRATADMILSRSAEFVNVNSGETRAFYAMRGACGFGYVPANGLLYQGKSQCICFPQMQGDLAFCSEPLADGQQAEEPVGERFVEGPGSPSTVRAGPGDWPTYRHDARRFGAATASVPAVLRELWTRPLGRGSVSSLVVVGDTVYVALIDRHKVAALDARNGEVRWTFTANGPVDSPPTFHRGSVLFGSHDGWAYCLGAANGRLMWRLRAAPLERRILVRERLESPWPVIGSVLTASDTAFFCAGRHSEADGGLYMFAVDPADGRIKWQRNIYREDAYVQANEKDIDTVNNDVLSSDGKAVYLGAMQFDVNTGKRLPNAAGPILWGGHWGMLFDNTLQPKGNRRDNWYYASASKLRRGRSTGFGPSGTTLSVDGRSIFGNETRKTSKAMEPFHLYCRPLIKGGPAWRIPVPEGKRVRAVLAAGDVLFVAVKDMADPGKSEVWALGVADGGPLGAVPLGAAPRHDGMAAVPGLLFVALENGSVTCLGE